MNRKETAKQVVETTIAKRKAKVKQDKILKSLLIYLYVKNKLSATEIAGQWGFDPCWILRLLDKYGIPSRTRAESVGVKTANRMYRNKKWLKRMYCKYKFNSVEIGKAAGCNGSMVRKWLNKYGIKRKEGLVTKIRRWLRK